MILKMKLNIKYLSFALGIIAGIVLSVTLLKRGDSDRSTEMGPGETVDAFYRAMAAGEFEQAKHLCDTLTMGDYLLVYSQAWGKELQENDDVASIASGILADADITINELKREGDKRLVFYTIDAGDGLKKDKIAVVKKEEGAWRVENITDRQ